LIRKLVGRVAVVAIVLGMTGAAPMAVAGAVPAAHVASNAISCVVQGFLDDGYGAGSAVSLQPGVTPAPGLEFSQESTGAWRLCYDTQAHLTLLAYPGTWCMANNNGNAELRPCNTHPDELWSLGCNSTSSSCLVINQGTNVLCAGGSVGAEDFVRAASSCSAYHENWQFESTS
jgi:hypothetical protein